MRAGVTVQPKAASAAASAARNPPAPAPAGDNPAIAGAALTGAPPFAPRKWIDLLLRGAVGVAVAVAAAAAVAGLAGVRRNTSASMPLGLWAEGAKPIELVRGQIVAVCPPDTPLLREALKRGYLERGACPEGYAPLLKPIAAIPGDLVQVGPEGIWVNGVLLARSQGLSKDPHGRAMPQLPHRQQQVPLGQVWLISTCDAASFDSRYFGPLDSARIRAWMRPLWVRSAASGNSATGCLQPAGTPSAPIQRTPATAPQQVP